MIVKLRNRLLRVIMAFVAAVMFLAFITIFAVIAIRVQSENREKITSEEIVSISSDGRVLMDDQELSNAVVINRISPALGVYFNLLTDQNGDLVYIDSALDLQQTVYDRAGGIALANPDGGMVELEGRKWQYVSLPATAIFSDYNAPSQGEYTLHRFLDVTDSIKLLATLAITLSCLYVALMLIFYFVAKYFANRSVQPMAEAWESQRQFISDASHELKTPISTLNANLDVLYASQDEPIKNQIRWLDNSKKVLHRMTALIKDMLDLAKMDEQQETLAMEDVNVNELIEEILDCFQPKAREKHIEILENAKKPLRIHSSHKLLLQIMEILVDNAVRYTEENGQIKIDGTYEKGGLVLRIQNTGAGISPADIDKIFDRFYRGDKARAYSDNNYGLGLPIARAAAKKLGGSLHAQSNPKMAVFILKLPNRKS